MKRKSKFKKTEIGMIPEDWEVKIIGDFLDIKHGFAFKGKFFSDNETDKVLLTPGNFKIGGGFKSDKLKYTTEESPKEYILKEGDIIVTMTDLSKKGDTLGYSAKIPLTKNKQYLHNQRIGLVKFKSQSVDPSFIYWVLRTKRYNLFVVGSATGSTVKHTSPNRIKLFTFGVPSINEQRAITKILSDLDAKIELLQNQNKTLEAIGQAIFKRWFVDFEFPNEEGKPYKSSGGEMVGSELGEMPKGWSVGKYDNLVSVSTGKGLKRDELIVNGKYSVLGANGELGRTDNYLFDENLIITGRVGTLGKVFLINDKVWVSDNVLISKPISEEKYYFAYFTIKMFDFRSMNRGSTQPLITQTDLKNQEILLPNDTILKKFHVLMCSLFDKIKDNDKKIVYLSEIRDSLLPRLMSGKIRVPVETNR